MSTRNPMNERYSSDEARTGTSRKSAASAKPKTKAASTVTIVSGAKTPQQKKAAAKQRQREEREKSRREESKFYNPPTARYKSLRRWWWVCLIGAIVATILSWLFQSKAESLTAAPSIVCMVLAYALIIGALIIDLGPTRKERKRYAAAVADKDSPEHAEFKERERAAREAEKANKAEAKAAYDASKEAGPKEGGLFARLKKRTTDAADTAKAAQAEAEAGTSRVERIAARVEAIAGTREEEAK
ncbi:MAG: hypothetical protein IJG53_05405 [Eggerthellaceae bacterium]|nr:hypothetical protein [Eggerthellaceae bacterium]